MMSERNFNHEELSFEHEEEEFIYVFFGYPPSGVEKVRMRRVHPLPPVGEEKVYPNGSALVANTAILVLYKASLGGQPMIGFLPDVLKGILKMSASKEATVAGLKKAIDAFPVKTPIAKVENVMSFLEPYCPWTGTTPTMERNKTPKAKTPDNSTASKTPTTDTTLQTRSPSPPSQQQSSPLSAVLTEPASRKHALEQEDETVIPNDSPPKKKVSTHGASSTASLPSTPTTSLILKNLAVIQRSSSTFSTKPKQAKPSVAKKSAPSTLALGPNTDSAKVTKPPTKETSQKEKLQRLMKIQVEASKLHELATTSKNALSSNKANASSQPSPDVPAETKFYRPAKLQTWKKSTSQPPLSTTPVTVTAMTKSVSTTPPSAPITKITAPPPPLPPHPSSQSFQSEAIQTQKEPAARGTPDAPISDALPLPTPANARDSPSPSLAQPTITPTATTSVEQSPHRHRIICDVDDDRNAVEEESSPSASTSEDSLPSPSPPPPRNSPVQEIAPKVTKPRKIIIKLRDSSPPRPRRRQTIDLTSSAPTSPIQAPDRIREIVVKSPRPENPHTNDMTMPSPTTSDLSSLSSQFEDDIKHIPTSDTLTDEFRKQDQAIQAIQEKQRQKRLNDFIATKDLESRVLQRLLKEETARCDEVHTDKLQAEVRVQALQHTVAELTSKLEQSIQTLAKEEQLRRELETKCQEAESIQLEAEKRCERAEEALDLARRVHTRDKAQWKKDTDKRIYDEVVAAVRTSRNQIHKELAGQHEKHLASQKETLRTELEEQVRKQFVEENEKWKKSLSEENEKLKKELEGVTKKRDDLVLFLKPLSSGLGEYLN